MTERFPGNAATNFVIASAAPRNAGGAPGRFGALELGLTARDPMDEGDP
jgi:hypothetical protein